MIQTTPLIELRRVTKTYGAGATALQALKGVDLTIEAGDFVAIMGPSGSGKSTAMNILGCLDTPTSGEYLFRAAAFWVSFFRDSTCWHARLRRKMWNCPCCTAVSRRRHGMRQRRKPWPRSD